MKSQKMNKIGDGIILLEEIRVKAPAILKITEDGNCEFNQGDTSLEVVISAIIKLKELIEGNIYGTD